MELSHYDVDVQVCSDLITNYPLLFNVDNLEVEKERRMLEVLEKINFPTPTSMKRSGDIRMWIYIESRTSGDCISLILHPSLTAAEAVSRAGQEAGLEAERLEEMFIHEVVLGGALQRPLHHTDRLLDVTLRWGSWAEADRHDNHLLQLPSLSWRLSSHRSRREWRTRWRLNPDVLVHRHWSLLLTCWRFGGGQGGRGRLVFLSGKEGNCDVNILRSRRVSLPGTQLLFRFVIITNCLLGRLNI